MAQNNPQPVIRDRTAVAPAAAEVASPVADFAKQDVVERLLRGAEHQAGDRTFDPIFRARVAKQLLTKSSDELLKIESDKAGLTPVVTTLGSATGDLVYTPLAAPCRIFDSRAGSTIQGDGTGPLAVGNVVPIHVSTLCGIPFPLAKAVTLNFVAALPSGVGNLRAWPYDTSVPAAPNASIINFSSSMNLANGVVVPICNTATATGGNCSFDLFIEPFVHSTDVVIDALGYFAPPQATALDVVKETAPFDCAPQTTFFASTPACPVGYTLTGGGLMFSVLPNGLDGGIVQVSGESSNAWLCGGFNNRATGSTHWTGTCTAYCARIP